MVIPILLGEPATCTVDGWVAPLPLYSAGKVGVMGMAKPGLS
jgi:hypothetical protein